MMDDDDDIELLMLGAQKILRICCTGTLPWDGSALQYRRYIQRYSSTTELLEPRLCPWSYGDDELM